MATKKTAKKAAAKKAPAKTAAAKKVAPAKKAVAKKAPATKAAPATKTAAKKAAPAKSAAPARAAAPAKQAAAKTGAKKRALNPALAAPLQPSAELAVVVGEKPLPRFEVAKKIWDYIKANGLQDTVNRRNINADDKLGPIFGGKKQVSMFEMTALVNKHLKQPA